MQGVAKISVQMVTTVAALGSKFHCKGVDGRRAVTGNVRQNGII